jgi:metal-dependent amidase/aminoacylase/carboxypeptidase family protein
MDDGLVARLKGIYEDLHRHPELSFEEEETARRLTAALSELSTT